MSGLRQIPDSELPEDMRDYVGTPVSSVARIFGNHPDLWRAWSGFYARIMQDGAVPMRLKEIVRLRIAGLNGCSV